MRKKFNVILFVLVAVVWGFVAYNYSHRFFGAANVSDKVIASHYKEFRLQGKDTFKLLPLKRDPFLGNSYSTPKIPRPILYQKKPATISRKPPAPAIVVAFPKIEYFGYIASTHEKGQLVLIRINNKFFRMKMGQSKEGLSILKANKDSISILFQSQKRTFGRMANRKS